MTYVQLFAHLRAMNTTRKSYPSDVSDADWAFLAPYLTLMREDAPQRDHPIRELYNGLCYVVKTVANGVLCRTIFLRGRQFISKRVAGTTQEFSKLPVTICV